MDARVITDTARFLTEFCDALQWADEIDLAVAWANSSGGRAAHWAALEAARAKVRRMVVGVSFGQTEPEALERLLSWGCVRVLHPDQGTFHPKVVLARKGERARALVGSSNLTGGGFGANVEVSVALAGGADEPQMVELDHFVDAIWKRAVVPPSDWLAKYVRYRDAMPKSTVPFPKLPRPRVVRHEPVESGPASPYEAELPLPMERSTLERGLPFELFEWGLLAVEAVARVPSAGLGELGVEQRPPLVVQCSSAGRNGWQSWVVGNQTIAVVALRQTQVAAGQWNVPIADWFDEDLCGTFVRESLVLDEGDLVSGSAKAPLGRVRGASAVRAENALAACVAEPCWLEVGALDLESCTMLVQFADGAGTPTAPFMLTSEPDGMVLTAGGASGSEASVQLSDGESEPLRAKVPRVLFDVRLWPTGEGTLLVEPVRGVACLRFGHIQGLLVPMQCETERAGAVCLLDEAVEQTSLPAASAFTDLFAESVRWVMTSGGDAPCVTLGLDAGFVELADLGGTPWDQPGRRRERALALNVSLPASLDVVIGRADQVRDRHGLEYATVGWTTTDTMESMSFWLPDAANPLAVVEQVEAVLVTLWGRAPVLADATGLEWRFLGKRRRGARSRKIRFRAPRRS